MLKPSSPTCRRELLSKYLEYLGDCDQTNVCNRRKVNTLLWTLIKNNPASGLHFGKGGHSPRGCRGSAAGSSTMRRHRGAAAAQAALGAAAKACPPGQSAGRPRQVRGPSRTPSAAPAAASVTASSASLLSCHLSGSCLN